MTDYKEFKLDIQIWDSDHWASDYSLDIDLAKDRNQFMKYLNDTMTDEFEIIIKLRPKIGGEENDE